MAEKHYNLDYLQSISGGDEDFVKDMLMTFITNVPEELAKLKNLLAEKNWQKVGENAHKFASSLLLLKLEHLKDIATQIEEYGLENKNIDQIPILLTSLESGCFELIEELKRDFNI